MPTNDLSPAAEALLGDLAHWLPKDVLEEARGRLAGLLAEERAAIWEQAAVEAEEVADCHLSWNLREKNVAKSVALVLRASGAYRR